MHKALDSIPTQHSVNLSMVAHSCHPSIRETGAGDQKFKFVLGYILS